MTAEAIVFINPRGESVNLRSTTADILWGITGRFMPPIKFVEDETPEREGARVRRVKVPPREVAIPACFRGLTSVGLRSTLRTVVRRMYPALGDGRLHVTAPDGTVRELVCRYSQGLEGNETEENGGTRALKVVLVFRAAEDPFWRAAKATTFKFQTAPPTPWFPIFPLSLSPSSIIGGIVIDNPGDVETWPRWTLTGPGGPVTLTNETTGESLILGTVLAAGDVAVIDTSPGVKTVTLDDGTNLYGDLDPGSSLFPLAPGENDITVDFTGSTVASRVALSFRPRFLTP